MRQITRDDWGRQFLFCFLCGRSTFRGFGCDQDGPWHLETHEIARGNHRKRALTEPATWIRTCDRCHAKRLDGCPVVLQLAVKKMYDQEHYDREAVNRVRKRAINAITEAEVDAVVALLEGGETFDRVRKLLLEDD